MRIRRAAVTASIALLVLAGCGGGDDSADTDSPAPGTQGDSGATTPPPAPGGGGGLGMGPETFARQLLVALRAESYTVDGSTITMTFAEGTTADAEAKCTIAAATVGANASVILAYPDGETPCE